MSQPPSPGNTGYILARAALDMALADFKKEAGAISVDLHQLIHELPERICEATQLSINEQCKGVRKEVRQQIDAFKTEAKASIDLLSDTKAQIEAIRADAIEARKSALRMAWMPLGAFVVVATVVSILYITQLKTTIEHLQQQRDTISSTKQK